MSCATLAVLQSETGTHELVPRGRANNKQTSPSSITLCALVDRVRRGLPAVFHKAGRRVHTAAGYGPRGIEACRKILKDV
jgi:hypothetical protein